MTPSWLYQQYENCSVAVSSLWDSVAVLFCFGLVLLFLLATVYQVYADTSSATKTDIIVIIFISIISITVILLVMAFWCHVRPSYDAQSRRISLVPFNRTMSSVIEEWSQRIVNTRSARNNRSHLPRFITLPSDPVEREQLMLRLSLVGREEDFTGDDYDMLGE